MICSGTDSFIGQISTLQGHIIGTSLGGFITFSFIFFIFSCFFRFFSQFFFRCNNFIFLCITAAILSCSYITGIVHRLCDLTILFFDFHQLSTFTLLRSIDRHSITIYVIHIIVYVIYHLFIILLSALIYLVYINSNTSIFNFFTYFLGFLILYLLLLLLQLLLLVLLSFFPKKVIIFNEFGIVIHRMFVVLVVFGLFAFGGCYGLVCGGVCIRILIFLEGVVMLGGEGSYLYFFVVLIFCVI